MAKLFLGRILRPANNPNASSQLKSVMWLRRSLSSSLEDQQTHQSVGCGNHCRARIIQPARRVDRSQASANSGRNKNNPVHAECSAVAPAPEITLQYRRWRSPVRNRRLRLLVIDHGLAPRKGGPAASGQVATKLTNPVADSPISDSKVLSHICHRMAIDNHCPHQAS